MPIDPEEFKRRDAASYDGIADRFDYWTERVTKDLAQDLVAIADLKPGESVLDVGTGSGIVARAAATGEITGIDLSERMLEVARSRSSHTISFVKMDAEHLEFEAGSFDVAVSLFAILHFPHPELAIREIRRVTKAGGRVVLGVGRGAPLSWAGIVSLWNRVRESGNSMVAPRPLLGPAEHETATPRKPERLERLLRNAGFVNVRHQWKSYTHEVETAAAFWDLHTTFSSVDRKRLELAAPAAAEKARAEFCAKCDAVLAKGGRLIYRNAAEIVSAVRP